MKNKIDLSINDEHLIAIGTITCNFAMLEHLVSFSIWSMIKKEDIIVSASEKLEQTEFESLLQFCISTSVGLENAFRSKLGQIITAELSFSQRVHLLSSIYRYKAEKGDITFERDIFDNMITRLFQAEEKRNSITHSLWAISDEEDTSIRIKITAKKKMGLNLQSEKLRIEDLNKVADFIAEVAYSVQEFGISLYHSENSLRKPAASQNT